MIADHEYQRVCEERDQLAEEVAWLKEELLTALSAEEASDFRTLFGRDLRPAAACLLKRLYDAGGEFVALNRLNMALPDLEGGPCVERIKVHIKNIRSVLGQCAVETSFIRRNREYTAYRLTEEGMLRVGAMVKPGRAKAA